MELKCPSIDYVNSMTWAEFQIRSYAYRRIEEKTDLRVREIAYNAYISSNIVLKKIPKKDKFWQIGNKNISTNDAMTEAIKKAQENYFKELKEKENGN